MKYNMRMEVERAVRKFRISEDGLLGKEWDDIYFEVNGDTLKVRHVPHRNLSDADLLRFLLYLTKQRDGAIERRISTQVEKHRGSVKQRNKAIKMVDSYFVISNSDGDTTVTEMSKETLLERIEEKYWGDKECLIDYTNDTNYWGDGIMIIKGKIVTPTPKKVIMKYEVE